MKLKDDRKVSQIFSATVKLVAEYGLVGITMGQIAKKAGIATGTLYVYFKSKEELVNALFAQCRKASVQVYFRGYDPDAPFRAGFRTIWMNILHYRLKNFEEAVFMEQCYHCSMIMESTREITEQLLQPLFQLMDRGKEEQLIKPVDTWLLLSAMIGSISEPVKFARYAGKTLEKGMIEHAFRLCWDALKA